MYIYVAGTALSIKMFVESYTFLMHDELPCNIALEYFKGALVNT